MKIEKKETKNTQSGTGKIRNDPPRAHTHTHARKLFPFFQGKKEKYIRKRTREVGTEGHALNAYLARKTYSKTSIEFSSAK